jgi:hypothetical protein
MQELDPAARISNQGRRRYPEQPWQPFSRLADFPRRLEPLEPAVPEAPDLELVDKLIAEDIARVLQGRERDPVETPPVR